MAPCCTDIDNHGAQPSGAFTFGVLHQAHNTADVPGPHQNPTSSPGNRLPSTSSFQSDIPRFITQQSNYGILLHQSSQDHRGKICQGFAAQRMCISEIFLCHDSNVVESVFAKFNFEQNTKTMNAILCELSAITATGGQCVPDLIALELLDWWYGRSMSRSRIL